MATVLIVDDEKTSVEALAHCFEMMGWHTITAGGGRHAIDLLASHAETIDAIILDRSLPDLSGDEVLLWLYENQSIDGICVVMLTGHATHESVVSSLQAGAWQYLSKPIVPASLISLIAPGVALKKCHRMRRAILSATDLSEAIDMIRRVIVETLAPDYCQVTFLGASGRSEYPGDSTARRALVSELQGKRYVAEFEQSKVRALEPVIVGAAAIVAVPVFTHFNELMIGVLEIESRQEGAFSIRWIEVLRYFADLIGTFETLRETRLGRDVDLISRELRHRLATSVSVVSQEIREFERMVGDSLEPARSLSTVSRHIENIRSVMDQLRNASKDIVIHPEEVSPYQVIDQVLNEFRRVAEINHVSLSGPIERVPGLSVTADPNVLAYCLDCVIQNAFEAIEDRKRQDNSAPTLNSVAVTLESKESTVRIVVDDTGIGFRPEVCERLFLPLFSTKIRPSNDGIGLYSLRRMMGKMGGRVEAASPGEFRGARFTLVLQQR